MVLYFIRNVGVFATSRNISLKTFRFSELTGKLLFAGFHKAPFNITIDCEAIIEKPVDTRPYTAKGEVTKTSLHSTTAVLSLEDNNSRKLQRDQNAPLTFKVLDITQWEGVDIKHQPLRNRLGCREAFMAFVAGTELGQYFKKPESAMTDKKKFLEKIWSEGGEGVILKNMRAPYEDSSSRPRDHMVKVKKRIEFDAFVTGFKRGEAGTGFENLVGALEFSVNLTNGKTHVLGYPINMTLEERQRITAYDPVTNQVSLIPEYYGRVAEISGQDISARELRLSHCTLDRWRDQPGDVKLATDCVQNLEELKQAAEWVG
jgi:ATP-dependent DNA ligase